MIRDLPITTTFTVPIELATRKTSIIAKSDAGKSYTLRRILECIVASGFAIPGAHIDPLGVAYGVRYGPDGESAGLSVPIFGGSHGDMPITFGSGGKIARALIDAKTIGILDLSALDDEEQLDFVRDFVRAAGKILSEARQPFWLGCDEADLFAPETPSKIQVECQRAMRYYCRRVRNFGGGYTFATQSTSVIDKKVVGQSDLIIAMHITSPTDQKPVIEWLAPGLGEGEAKKVIRLLAHYEKGDAFFYSPAWLKRTESTHISKCETFDSSKTPEIGEVLETVGRGAAIDLAALAEALVSEAPLPGTDPAELHAIIVGLQKRLEIAERTQAIVERNVSILSDEDAEKIIMLHTAFGDLAALTQEANVAIDRNLAELIRTINERLPAGSRLDERYDEKSIARLTYQKSGNPEIVLKKPEESRKARDYSDRALRSGAIRMLEACATFFDRGLTRSQLAALARIKQGPTYSTYLSDLRKLGFVEETDGRIYATTAGLNSLPAVPKQPRTPNEILDQWRPEFRSGELRMLDFIVAAYPKTVSRNELVTGSGILQGPTFSTYVSKLKRAELIDERSGGLYAVVLDLITH